MTHPWANKTKNKERKIPVGGEGREGGIIDRTIVGQELKRDIFLIVYQPLKVVGKFKYLGRMLDKTYILWMALYASLLKSMQLWG